VPKKCHKISNAAARQRHPAGAQPSITPVFAPAFAEKRLNPQSQGYLNNPHPQNQDLDQDENLSQNIFDSLSANIAVLDENGTITAVTQSWTRFTRENGGIAGLAGVGVNYLRVCQAAVNNSHDPYAKAALDGIRAVLSGDSVHFKLEYPCHSPTEQRWFAMIVTPRAREVRGVVITHETITERKRAEETLRYQANLLQNISDAVIATDNHFFITSWNKAAEDIYGWRESEVLGKTVSEILKPVYINPTRPEILIEFEAFGIWKGETLHFRKDGTEVHIHGSTSRLFNLNGEEIGAVSINRDITLQKHAEEALRESENKFRQVTDRAPIAITWSNPQGKIEYINQAFFELFGYTLNEIPTVEDWFCKAYPHPDERALITAEWADGMKKVNEHRDEHFTMQASVTCKNGEVRRVQITSTLINEVTYATFNDISEQVQAEETIRRVNVELEKRVQIRTAELEEANRQLQIKMMELNESETKYRIVADNTYGWEYWKDPQGQFIYNSPSCETLTGYKPQQFLDNPALLIQIIHPEDRPLYQQHEEHVLNNHSTGAVEFRIVHRDGSVRWIGHVCQVVFDDQECFLGNRCSNRDITQRKQAQELLEASERQLSLVYNHVSDTLFNLQVEAEGSYRFISINKPFFANLNLDAKQIVGKRLQEIASGPLLSRAINQYQEVIRQGKTIHWEEETETPAGRITSAVAVTPIFDKDGRCTNLIGIVHDITSIKRAEQEIQKQAQRAEALVRTAAQFNARLDLEAVLNTVCQEAMVALNASAAEVRIYNDQRGVLDTAAHFGFSPENQQQHLPVPRASFEKIFSQLEAEGIIPDVQAVPNLTNATLYASENIRTMMIASILLDQNLVGTISVFSRKEIRLFKENDLSLLKALANQAAQAINNARLFEQVTAGQERLRMLSQQLVEVQEAERRTLALELHDELGQVLNSVKLSMDMIPQLPSLAGQKQYRLASALISTLIERVRRMSLELRPSLLDDLGLLPTLNWLFENYEARTQQPVIFQHSGLDQDFSPRLGIVVYRIAQEALTNVVRHAQHKKVFVDIWLDKHYFYLRIMDHGGGFDIKKMLITSKSTGLSGMRERARLLGGELVIESTPGDGTTLTASLPLAPADDHITSPVKEKR
jgi:PAS domain S-box-containing protein